MDMTNDIDTVPQVRGGLTFREGHFICEAIHETGLLVALDLMVCTIGYLIFPEAATEMTQQEVNPGLADAESARNTVSVGCSLVRAALGSCTLVRIRHTILNMFLQVKPCCERAKARFVAEFFFVPVVHYPRIFCAIQPLERH